MYFLKTGMDPHFCRHFIAQFRGAWAVLIIKL